MSLGIKSDTTLAFNHPLKLPTVCNHFEKFRHGTFPTLLTSWCPKIKLVSTICVYFALGLDKIRAYSHENRVRRFCLTNEQENCVIDSVFLSRGQEALGCLSCFVVFWDPYSRH